MSKNSRNDICCCQDIEKIKEFLKIIAEENRLEILCFLKSDKKCVYEIWRFLNLPQNLISHHLKILKDFGLITAEKKGLNVFYSLNKKLIKNYYNSLIKII